MRIQFRLRPVDDIAPWGPVSTTDVRATDWLDRPHLHWFALTDGWYWIEAGEAELFRYSQAEVNAAVQEDPNAPWAPQLLEMPYVDYYVVRLWEDLLEILPDVLEPVPSRLAAPLESERRWMAWERQAKAAVEAVEDEILNEKASDLLEAAAGWWWNRHLDTLYLQAGPQIWFWSDGRNAHVEWDNQTSIRDGIPVWETSGGSHSMPAHAFLQEIRAFDARLMRQMQDRITSVQTEWTRPEIALDPGLTEEHLARSRRMQQCMESIARHPPTAWDEVFHAIAQIEALPTFPTDARLAL